MVDAIDSRWFHALDGLRVRVVRGRFAGLVGKVTGASGAEPMFFCGWDCAMKYGATLPPEEIIPWNPEVTGE